MHMPQKHLQKNNVQHMNDKIDKRFQISARHIAPKHKTPQCLAHFIIGYLVANVR